MTKKTKCIHGAIGDCPDCKQENTLMGGVGEVTTRRKTVSIKVDVFDANVKPIINPNAIGVAEPTFTITPAGKVKIGMCAWHTCQTKRTVDSRLCKAHQKLQAQLDATPLPKAK